MFHKVLFCALSVLVLLEFVQLTPDVDYYKAEKEILDKIMLGYEKLSPPKTVEGTGCKVNHSLNLIEFQLDVKKQVLSTTMYESLFWKDSRLAWEPSDYDKEVNTMVLSPDNMWTPDISVFNSVDKPVRFLKAQPIVFSSGLVYYVPFVSYKTPCPVSESVEAGDDVYCRMDVGSWSYTTDVMEPVLHVDHVTTDWVVDSHIDRDWKYVNSTTNKVVTDYQGYVWTTLSYTIHLKRTNHVA